MTCNVNRNRGPIRFDGITYPYSDGNFELDMATAEIAELDHYDGCLMWGILVQVRTRKCDGTWSPWETWGITFDVLGRILAADHTFRLTAADFFDSGP